MEYKDYYDVLGIPKTASQADVKKAYRRLARELHPDRNPGDEAAEKRFKDANEAHAVLSDPEKRKHYDELGANWQAYEHAGYGRGGATDWAGFGGAPGGTRWEYRRVSPEDLGGFSDFFRTFFGGEGFAASSAQPGFEQVFEFGDLGGSSRAASRPSRVATAQAEAEVTLAEVARGAERMVNVDGRRLQVKIPPGVTDGSRIRLRGGGLKGAGQAGAGDLVINVRVQPDPRFERRGADLVTELPLTLAEAMLGAEVRVPTPTGSVKLRIRPNTQNGQEIRVAGRGLPKRASSEKGDLLVRIRVILPELDAAQREELARILGTGPHADPGSDGKVH